MIKYATFSADDAKLSKLNNQSNSVQNQSKQNKDINSIEYEEEERPRRGSILQSAQKIEALEQ